MSANKEQSDRCIELSKQYHKAGDAAQAMKFAKKAVKLDSSYDAAIKWESFLTSNPTIIPTTRKRSSPAAKKEEPEPSRPFTQDQVKGIKQILDKKNKGDLYGILGLEKDCSNSDIKKSYRKAALLYHPDKCGAPGTDDAFKVLGDADKRSNYDRFGIDSEASGAASRGGGNPFQGFQGFGGQAAGFEGEITPEDLLRMFMGGGRGGGFGGGFGPGFSFQSGPGFRNGNQRARQHQRQQGQPQGDRGLAATILQFLPVLLLFFLSAISLFVSEDDPFSFSRSYEYSLSKETPKHNVKYFVNQKNYQRRFGTTRKQTELENRVDDEYLHHIRIQCGHEKDTKQFYIRQATSWFSVNQEKLAKAQNMKMANCEVLQSWYSR